MPSVDRLPHCLADIDAGNRAAGARADAAGLQRDREGGPRELLLQPGRNETDHARMPAFGGRHDDADLVLEPDRGECLGFGLRFGACSMPWRSLLRRSSSAAIRAASTLSPSKSSRTPRSARPMRPPALMRGPSMKPRCQGLRRAVEPRHVHQRGVADMVAPPHRDQAFCDESAVETDQRRDIGNRAERNVMQHAEQIRLGHLRIPEAALA